MSRIVESVGGGTTGSQEGACVHLWLVERALSMRLSLLLLRPNQTNLILHTTQLRAHRLDAAAHLALLTRPLVLPALLEISQGSLELFALGRELVEVAPLVVILEQRAWRGRCAGWRCAEAHGRRRRWLLLWFFGCEQRRFHARFGDGDLAAELVPAEARLDGARRLNASGPLPMPLPHHALHRCWCGRRWQKRQRPAPRELAGRTPNRATHRRRTEQTSNATVCAFDGGLFRVLFPLGLFPRGVWCLWVWDKPCFTAGAAFYKYEGFFWFWSS